MNLIDSSCWLEYFSGRNTCKEYEEIIEDISNVIVPVIVLYEVFKKLIIETSEGNALKAVAHMQLGKVVTIDSTIAISAARISVEYKLPMADSIILAIARRYNSTIYTHDEHFACIQGVRYFPK